jgi:hypothetical protein
LFKFRIKVLENKKKAQFTPLLGHRSLHPSRALPSQTRPDRGRPAQMAGEPRRPAPYKRRWGPAALRTRLTVPYTPPTPQTLADLVVRRSQRRDCSPSAPRRRPTPPPSPVSAVGDPKVVGISSEPPPAPPRHRQSLWRLRRRQHPRGVPRPTKVSRTPSLSLSHG